MKSDGSVDEIGIQNLQNAESAGWPVFDGYIFPCVGANCPSAHDQALNVITRLREVDAEVGTLWVDVERLAWPTDKKQNQEFISEMMTEIDKCGVWFGIYTNYEHWNAIVGVNWTVGPNRRLWWASYDNHQDFTGFKPFGGWSRPDIHQYSVSIKGPCGVAMNQN
uniref:Lysozyme n=1 Tax=Panagrolaimus sp. JU765 TaxID=591449 RepID=A0AC34R1A4_9BILA